MLYNVIDITLGGIVIASTSLPMVKREVLSGLYGISDNALTPKSHIFAQIKAAKDGGMRIFQYRDKDSKDSQIYEFVQELQDFCWQNNILFVLNDRYELAMKLQVSALHLGKEELQHFDEIRPHYRGIIGVSCYDSIDMASQYEAKGADYVAFGALFSSLTKPQAIACPLSVLSLAKQRITIPICGIGGINTANANKVYECDMIAVISGLWNDYHTFRTHEITNFDYIHVNAKEIIQAWKLQTESLNSK